MVMWQQVAMGIAAALGGTQLIRAKCRKLKGVPSANGQVPLLGHVGLLRVRTCKYTLYLIHRACCSGIQRSHARALASVHFGPCAASTTARGTDPESVFWSMQRALALDDLILDPYVIYGQRAAPWSDLCESVQYI